MTPDIQELKRLAEAATQAPSNCRNQLKAAGKPHPRSGCTVCKTGGVTGCPYERKDIAIGMSVSPSTILALIEVAEAAEKAHEARKTQSFTDLLLAMERIRTALEGVKK